jgi:hypothetical protein
MNDDALSDDDIEAGLKGDKVRVVLITRVMRIAREIGMHEGSAEAYKDVLAEIGTAIANAEDELTRAPKSEILMGEIMALRRLAVHFAPAPGFHEHRSALYAERLHGFIDRLLTLARDAVAREGARE